MIPGIGGFTAIMPLMGKTLQELSLSDLSNVADVFGFEVRVTEELKEAALALLKGENINKVADMIQSPESVIMLVDFLRRAVSTGDDDYDRVFGRKTPDPEVPILTRSVSDDVTLTVPRNELISSPFTGWKLA